MKNFRTLLKMISRNNDMEMPEHGEKAKGYKVMGIIAMCCIMIPCCLVVGFIVYIMTAALMEAGGQTEGLNLVIQLMSVFGVIFSIMVIFNLLYFSSDLDHLLPLPVKPAELVAAKFTHAYFAESVMEFMVLFCGFIGYFIAAELKPVSVLTSIIGVFLLPVLPLVYCGVFSLIIMAFFSRAKLLKNVDFMVGLAILVFAGLFVWSFAQMDSVNINNYINSLKNGDNIFINIMNRVFFTVPLFIKALQGDSIVYMFLFILVNALCVALLLALGNALYLKGVYLVSSSRRSRRRRREKAGLESFAIRTPFKAYLDKEFKTLVRTPAYRKYCAVVNIIWPILIIALFNIPATADSIREFRATFEKGYFLSDVIVLIVVTIIAFFATAMNSIASTSFTREGSHISFIKHIPMAYSTQVRVKVWISILFSGITIIISTVILSIYMDCSFVDSVYYIVIGVLCVGICTYTGVLLDSTHPKIDWEDEYGALRGNLNAFFNMAIAIVIAIVFCTAGYLLFRFTWIPSIAVYIIYLMILGAILILMRRYTMKMSENNIDTDAYSE